MGRATVCAALAAVVICLAPARGLAQITTATVSGTIKDAQGATIPGATVTLISETRGTNQAVQTNISGDYVFPNVIADTYTVQVSMDGFKTLKRGGLAVSPGDRIVVPALTIEMGAVSETVVVRAEAPLVQAQSGERSFAIKSDAVQNIAVNGRSFNSLTFLAPGVVAGTVNGARVNQNNYQVDGVGTMDTGNNGLLIQVAVDAIAEVKILTTNYQAEYGRSVGAQISAVTKSGTSQFRGSIYADRRRDDLNANTWINNAQGLPKQVINQSDEGYSIGGPVGRPGGSTKLFFFANQEWQQRKNPNNLARVRVPTELERQGDFSQTLDSSGNLFTFIRDSNSGLPCTATDTRGCYRDGGVLGRIPQSALYGPGLAALNMYPKANSPGTLAQGYNYVSQESSEAPRRQDLIRLDYQPNANWRFYGKLLRTTGNNITPYGGGTTGFSTNLPQFGSTNPCPCNRSISGTATGTLSATTVVEITYGNSHNSITNYARNPDLLNKSSLGLSSFPLLYPNAVQRDYPPSFVWGGRVGTSTSPTNVTQYAPFENFNTTQDVVASVTHILGEHTAKAGIFVQHALKSQSSRAAANGLVDFGNDTSNPFDTNYPFANAAIGSFRSYTQAADWVKGHYVYNNVEWYVQDNWKVSSHLTLDYGLRFYWVQPTYDTGLLTSNFLPEQYSLAAAPRLYYPGLQNGARVAVDPVSGQTLPAVNIGRIVPGSGTLVGNGLYQGGQGIDEHLIRNTGIEYAPRFGFAYDVTGTQKLIVRGAAGIFYDRGAGDTVYPMLEQPPTVVQPQLLYGRLQDLTSGTAVLAPPTINAFEYDSPLPTVYNFNAGVQMALPWSTVLDVSYVGSRARHLYAQHNINAPDYGAAYLAQNQDPTLPASSIPGSTSYPVDLLRPYRGFGDIIQIGANALSNYNSMQVAVNRRFTNGLSFGVNYTLGKAMGTASTDFPAGTNNQAQTLAGNVLQFPRNDENQRRANYMPLDIDRRHNLVTNFVWQLPKTARGGIVGAALNNWQLSGVFSAVSGAPYTVTYSIPGISRFTLTGTQGLENARIVINGEPGSGHGSNPYQQFNTSAFTAPTPGSIGLESGLNYLTQAPQRSLDLSLSRGITIGGTRRLEVRIDAFNALNMVNYTTVNNVLQVRSLADPTPTNLATDATGKVVNPTGFGAVTAVGPARQIQLMARFQF